MWLIDGTLWYLLLPICGRPYPPPGGKELRSKEKYNMSFLNNEFDLHENEQVCRIFIRNGFTRRLVKTHT